MQKKILALFVFLIILSCSNNEHQNVAYTWFGRPNYDFSLEKQKHWIGFTKETKQGFTQFVREFSKDSSFDIQVGTVSQNDDHNQPQILLRSEDKRLLVFNGEHNGDAIRYRISKEPLDASEWGGEFILNPLKQYSYLSPFQDSQNNIFLFFRSHSGDREFKWYYMKSIDGGKTFGSPVVFYENGNTQNYLIPQQFDDKIHFAASNGHPDHGEEVSVFHFYIDLIKEKAFTSNGDELNFPLSPFEVTPVFAPENYDNTWILDISVKDNFPRILFSKYPDGLKNESILKELWFSEFDGINWKETKISHTMNGYIEDDENLQEQSYSGASRFDSSNPDIIWMPKQVNCILELHKVDLTQTPPTIDQLTFDSDVDNWRPFSVPSDTNNLFWLQKNRYDHYTDFDMELRYMTVPVK